MKKIRFIFTVIIISAFTSLFYPQSDWNEKWRNQKWKSGETKTSDFQEQQKEDAFVPKEESIGLEEFAEKEKKQDFKEIDLVLLAENSPIYEIGKGLLSITVERKLKPFYINKYETPYTIWYKIRKAAEKKGYNFQNPGQEGSYGRRGKPPAAKWFGQPVTMISWYDAVVWCNALSELEGLEPCYIYEGVPIKDSSNTAECDLCICNWNASGYRLPSEAEWEYAARYSPDGLQDGGKASGDFSSFSSRDAANFVAWTSANTSFSMPVGTAGISKSKDSVFYPGSGNKNGAGLFDMSGNLLEFCWDWFADYKNQENDFEQGPAYGSQRVSRGGSWSEYTLFFFVSDRYSFDPNEYYGYMGFRVCRSLK